MQRTLAPILGVLILKPIIRRGCITIEIIQTFLSILTLFILPVTIFASINIIKNHHADGITFILIIILLIRFNQTRVIKFYILFEIRLIPIFFLIIGWGYQPERIIASFTIFIYTFFRSLPLLIIIFLVGVEVGDFGLRVRVNNLIRWPRSISIFILLAFLVKIPVFIVHIWLPKAHVEAPVSGSIILAALILKLGGVGLIYITELLLSEWVLNLLISISAIGCLFLGVFIICCPDIKVIIAYSSVVHISILSVIFLRRSKLGLLGGLLMMVSHGFTSSGLFSLANSLYENRHRRRSILNKGLLSISPVISIIGFILITINFGGPFTVNLISEIIIISYLANINHFFSIIVFTMCFSALVYNLVFYSTINQGVNMSNIRSLKISSREIILLAVQTFPSFLILISLQL